MDELIYKAYLFQISDIYSKHCIVDLDYLKEVENKLINQKQYLPVIIRRYLAKDYVNYLKENNLYDTKLLEELSNSRNLTEEQIIIEFKKWINKNKSYINLFNQKAYDNLQSDLNKCKKEYEDLQLW